MAYSLVALCGGCGLVFTANPNRVPCYPVDLDLPPGPPRYRLSAKSDHKEPFCLVCFEGVQRIREKAGLERQHAMPGAWEPAEEVD